MSSTGTRISRSSGLRRPVSTTVHSRVGPDQEAADLVERPLRGRQPDPLDAAVPASCSSRSSVSARCAPRLVLRDGVDLVDDHPLGVAQELARPRGQHQVERLGRRDQDVRRLAQHRRALLLRRVAGADRDREVAADALERRAQVALDVVGERLQRRDVDQARLALAGRQGLGDEPVEAPEEGGQRLARARRARRGARARRPRWRASAWA